MERFSQKPVITPGGSCPQGGDACNPLPPYNDAPGILPGDTGYLRSIILMLRLNVPEVILQTYAPLGRPPASNAAVWAPAPCISSTGTATSLPSRSKTVSGGASTRWGNRFPRFRQPGGRGVFPPGVPSATSPRG